MLRLLWKEWHEVKWYLIGLVLGPWLLTLWPSSNLGYKYSYGVEAWDVQVLMLILAFWAATRMPGEMKANRLTARSLPVNPWLLWAVKFLPGLAVAILLPYWIHLAAAVRVPEAWAHAIPSGWHTPSETFHQIIWSSISLYAAGFAVSMLASSMAAVIVAWLVVFVGGSIAADHLVLVRRTLFHVYARPDAWIRGVLAVAAVLVAAAVWAKARTSGARRKWTVAAISTALAFPVAMLVACVYLAAITGNRWRVVQAIRSEIEWHHKDESSPRYLTIWHPCVESDDHKFIAYVVSMPKSQCEKAPHDGRFPPTADESRVMDCVRVRDARGTRTVTCQAYAAPMAWLPDDNLLLAVGRPSKHLDLVEWNRESGRITSLARFPSRMSVYGVAPRNDGAKIALFADPLRGEGLDLWMLDRKTRRLKLLRPGLGVSTWDDIRAGWLGDRLTFQKSDGKYWSIRWNGADLRPVFEPGSGNHG